MSFEINNIFYLFLFFFGFDGEAREREGGKVLDNKLGNKPDVQNRLMNRWIKEVRLSN